MNAVFASALGTLTGAIAARTRKPLLGALIGTLLFFLGSLICSRMMISPVEPHSHTTYIVVWAVITGYIAGSAGTLAGCHATVLHRCLLFIPPILLAGIWTAVEEKETQLRYAMYSQGCVITWNAVTHPEGRWEVRFQDSKLNDESLRQLIGPLARYQRLELDLSHTQVTDKSIESLQMLNNMVSLHLEKTAITDQAIAQLKNKLPECLSPEVDGNDLIPA